MSIPALFIVFSVLALGMLVVAFRNTLDVLISADPAVVVGNAPDGMAAPTTHCQAPVNRAYLSGLVNAAAPLNEHPGKGPSACPDSS